jgi:hypothetical protein
VSEASNLVLLVPEAQDHCNWKMPLDKRLTAPAHITLVYPFIPPQDLSPNVHDELGAFFAGQPSLSFTLRVGWFGREVLLLQPYPETGVVALTERVVERWPEYPYDGGVYDQIEPHLSLAFSDRSVLDPLAEDIEALTPIAVSATQVTLLLGPHEAIVAGPRFTLSP